MTQPSRSDSLIQMVPDADQPFTPTGTISHAEHLIVIDRPTTLQENEVIRLELYAEMPQLHRQVIQERASVKHYLAEQPTH